MATHTQPIAGSEQEAAKLLAPETYAILVSSLAGKVALCPFNLDTSLPAYNSEKVFVVKTELSNNHEQLSFNISTDGKEQNVPSLLSSNNNIALQIKEIDPQVIRFLLSIRLAVELRCSTIIITNIGKEQAEDLALVKCLEELNKTLVGREIRLLHATENKDDYLNVPLLRSRCLKGDFHVAVTVRTFSNDCELVDKLRQITPFIKLNQQSDKMEGARLIDFLSDADGLIVGMERPTREVLAQLPFLRIISKYGVGVDNIDFVAANDHSIPVHFKKGLNTDSVAELTLGFLIMLLRRIDASMAGYRAGKWNKTPGREICETTVGLIGYGIIGRVVAQKLHALGVKRVLVHDIAPIKVDSPSESCNLQTLLKESELVSLHISMNADNHHFVNDSFVEQMKDGAYLINTSRGEVVDEKSLIRALNSGKLAGAAIDVFENEPTPDSELSKTPNLITTCHIAGSSNRAIKNMGYSAIEGIAKAFSF